MRKEGFMTVLLFDCETTGLARGKNWETDFMDFPRIVQLSWKFLDFEKINDEIIKPEGWGISEKSIKIHGITNEKAASEGKPFPSVVGYFIYAAMQAEKIVAHNIYFDTSMIKANIKRYFAECPAFPSEEYIIEDSIKALHKDKRIDTMMKTISFCNLPMKNGKGKKYPTLEELYFKLFGVGFEGAHNAKNDVLALEKVYKKLIDLGVLK